MQNDNRQLPFYAAKLIMKYTHNLLSEEEKDQLDEWICESDENQLIFEDLTEGMDDNILDPHEFISEADEAIEIWVIAGLITKQLQGESDEIEDKYLDQWVAADEHHQSLYEMLLRGDFRAQMISWIKKYWFEKFNLN
jgi:hypothetical protein